MDEDEKSRRTQFAASIMDSIYRLAVVVSGGQWVSGAEAEYEVIRRMLCKELGVDEDAVAKLEL